MNVGIVAIILQEGGKLISELIRNRPRKQAEAPVYSPVIVETEITEPEAKATSVEAGCVPCAIGHLGTCSGLMAESLRFGREEGIGSDEVISRVNLCLDELNSMERVDLRPEMIAGLPEWEKELANKALSESRSARHKLEGISTIGDLEKVAADIQTGRQSIGKSWFKQKLAKMPKEEKAKIAEKAIEKLEEE